MELGLRGKVAAIAGGSAGIGRATAFRLAEEGARVAICARREGPLRATAAEIAAATGGEVLAVPADVADAERCAGFIQRVVDRFQRLDVLVNSAGCAATTAFETADDEAWRAAIALDLMAMLRCTQLAIPHMRRQGGGRIINLTVVGGQPPVPAGALGAARIHLTKALAHAYAADQILINAICLGYIKGARWEQRWQAQCPHLSLDEFYARQGASIPLQRLGEAEDVADLICFLASERARYITGAAINVDGGLSGTV
jgi:NAD(P)-dependent dehydrogenase (short-subunit alcohol dehydrogenase family)